MTEVFSVPMQSVESTNIDAVGHDAAANELHVRFKNGGHYVYADVHRTMYQNMLSAKSPGRYHANHIKDVFKHRKF